jgi:hypothetical protein
VHDWQVNKRAHLCYASEQGLCPKNKNHPIFGWMIIFTVLNAAISQALQAFGPQGVLRIKEQNLGAFSGYSVTS